MERKIKTSVDAKNISKIAGGFFLCGITKSFDRQDLYVQSLYIYLLYWV